MNLISVVFLGWLWMKHEKMNQALLFVPFLWSSMPSLCYLLHHSAATVSRRAWLELSKATWQKCVLFGLWNLPRLYPHFPESLSCLLHFPPEQTSPRSWALGFFPSHTIFLKTTFQSGEEGEMDRTLFLVSLPDCVLALLKGFSVWGPPLDSVVMISANKRTARCGVLLRAEPWVQVPLLALAQRSGVTSLLWVSQEGPSDRSSVGASLPHTEFTVFTPVTWNWLWWKYSYPRNQQTLQIRPPASTHSQDSVVNI